MTRIIGILLLMFWSFQAIGQVSNDSSILNLDTIKISKEAPEKLKLMLEEIIAMETSKNKKDYSELEIDGLVFDETKTKSGRDFYDFFYRDWEAPANSKNYSIFIVEKPFRLNTTLIEILINDIIVYQAFLQPRAGIVEQMAIESIASTKGYLERYDDLVRQLDGDDKSGTGIF